MPNNPTQFYNWYLPVEGQDPYFDYLDDVFNNIDSSVHSVELSLLPRFTIVFSAYPAAATAINPDIYTVDSTWSVASVANVGRIAGTFTLLNSGAQAFFNLRASGYFLRLYDISLNPTNAPTIGNFTKAQFRLVVSKSGVSSLVVPNNVGWIFPSNVENAHMHISHSDLRSLGPGTFTAELQIGVIAGGVNSAFSFDQNDSIQLSVLEIKR